MQVMINVTKHQRPNVSDIPFSTVLEPYRFSVTGFTVRWSDAEQSEIAKYFLDAAEWHVKHAKCCPKSAPRNLLADLRAIAGSSLPESARAGELVLELSPVLS